jgi:hypothetical protein
MAAGLRSVTVKIEPDLFEQIRTMAEKRGKTTSDTVRSLIRRGLDEKIYEENVALIAGIVREQLELVLKSYGLAAVTGGTVNDIKPENSLFDGRVALRRAFKNHSRCTVEKMQLIRWGN